MHRKLAAAVVVASMVGGAGAGIALTTPGLAGAADTATAAAPKTPPPFVTDALKKLVDAGTINQSQADAVAAALAAAQPPRGPGGPGHGPRDMGADLATAAKAIGISEADLRTALQSGQSIAAVAKAHNVDPQKVIDAVVADKEARLAEKVKAGELTQARADAKKADLAQHVADWVNRTGGPGGPGRGHGPRPDGPPPADAPADAPAAAAPAA
jgi:hypothetical protein